MSGHRQVMLAGTGRPCCLRLNGWSETWILAARITTEIVGHYDPTLSPGRDGAPASGIFGYSQCSGLSECPDANDPNGHGAGPQPMNKLGRLRFGSGRLPRASPHSPQFTDLV